MNVDRHVELDRRGKQPVIARIVEEAAVGRAVDHGADKAEFLHGALQFGRNDVRTLHRKVGKAGKAVRMTGDRLCQMVVDVARHRHAVRAGDEVGARAGDRQHLHRDACLIHRFEPALADLRQKLHRIDRARRDISRPEAARTDHFRIDTLGVGRN